MDNEPKQSHQSESGNFSDMEDWEKDMVNVLKESEPLSLPPEKMQALLSMLKPMVAERQSPPNINSPIATGRMRFREFFRLVRNQAYLLERAFWIVIGLLMVSNLALLASNRLQPLFTMLFLILPLVGGISMVYSLRSSHDGMGEIEQASTVGLKRIFAARLTLIFGLELLLALPLLIYYGVQSDGLVLARMVLAWLAPTVALSGMSLFLFSYWGEGPSIGISLLVWGSLILYNTSRSDFTGFAEMILTHLVFNPNLPVLIVLGLAAGFLLGALGVHRLSMRSLPWN